MKYVVEANRLWAPDEPSVQAIDVGSDDWFDWLADNDRFTFQHAGGRYSARREQRRGSLYWYAYRRQGGRLRKVYLGRPAELTQATLIAAGERLQREAGSAALGEESPSPGDAAAGIPSRPAPEALPRIVLNWLSPPVLPEHLLVRSRLIRQFDRPIILISAPSGYGKTTLLNQWQAALGLPVVWVSLNGEDNTVYTFWTAVLLAWQKIEPGHDLPLALLRSDAPPPIETLLLLILDSLQEAQSAHPGRKVVIVIDNYQRAQSPPLDASLQLFLEHLPPGLQIAISSREPLPFAMQRWRGKGLVGELTQDDLRLTLEEGLAYLDSLASQPLTERERVSLVVRAGGWPAGLNLLLLALRHQDNVHTYVATFSGHDRYLQDYVVGEVLGKHPPERQDFLLKTSLLKMLTGELCDALTGRDDGGALLAQLHRSNEFVSLVDETRGWYQYHDLFAKALQDELRLRHPALLPELHHRAAVWFLENDLFPEAMRHLLYGGEWSEAARLIDRAILSELRRGSDHRILRWVLQIPDALFLNHPVLPITYARLARGSLPEEQIRERLDRLVELIASRPEAQRTAAQRASLGWILDWRETRNWPAIDAAVTEVVGPEIAPLWRIFDLREGALRCMREGDLAGNERLLEALVRLARAEGLTFQVVLAQSFLVSTALRRGRLSAAEAMLYDVSRWLRAERETLPECASVLELGRARIYLARNQLTQARRALERAAAIDPYPTSLNVPILSHCLQAHLLNAQGDRAGARVSIQAARDLEAYGTRVITARDMAVHQAFILLWQGDTPAAEHILRYGLPPPAPDTADSVLYFVASAELELHRGNYAGAEAILLQAVGARPDVLIFTTLLPQLLLATLHWEQDKTHQARHELLQAVRAAEPEGIIGPFLMCGARLIPLLTLAAQSTSPTPGQRRFIDSVLAELRATRPDAPTLSTADLARRTLAAAISPREQELLRVLALGLTNREIAEQLMLEESTIRTHLRNIYRKLGVNSRVQAIGRAREIDLL